MFPLDPRAEEICIEDVSHALAHICRFNGHTSSFYSVAEHSCLVSDALPDELKLAGLLHDASEAYLCDVPRPIKRSPGFAEKYLRAEDLLMVVIAGKYEFDYPLHPLVKEIDNRILANEALQLMAPLHPEWKDRNNPIPGLVLPLWSPSRARAEFTDRYYRLIGLFNEN